MVFTKRASFDGAEAVYVVSDPIANEFFLIGEFEYVLLRALDSPITQSVLLEAFRDRFCEDVSIEEISESVLRLRNDNLVSSQGFGDGQRLARIQNSVKRSKLLSAFTGILSIRIPGFNPTALLQPLRVLGHLLFGILPLVVAFSLFLFTLLFIANSQHRLVDKLPLATDLVSFPFIASMALAFVVCKIMHELGHGIACQKMGYTCTEMGVLFLVFLPVMYCDVSNMWLEKNRWKRALVVYAGIHVELLIATVTFWVWFTLPAGHQIQSLLFSIMMVTSLNTIFVNGNPLMRYDGYYLLSDICDSPNLASRSKELFADVVLFFIGSKASIDLGSNIGLLVYGIAAFIYRWIVMAIITLSVWYFFRSRGMGNLGALLAGTLGTLVISTSLIGTFKMLRRLADSGMSALRFLVFVATICFIGWFIACYQYTYRIQANATFELAESVQIFATVDGVPQTHVTDGEIISTGQLIATIDSLEIERDLENLKTKRDSIAQQILNLKLQRMTNGSQSEIAFLEKQLELTDSQQALVRKRMDSLQIRSPVSGQFIANQKLDEARNELEIRGLKGSIFAEENEDVFVKRGFSFGYVGNQTLLRGVVIVPEYQTEFLSVGQVVNVFCNDPSAQLQGVVSRIGTELESTEDGNPTNESNVCRVEFMLDRPPNITIGSNNVVSFECSSMSTIETLKRWLSSSIWNSGF